MLLVKPCGSNWHIAQTKYLLGMDVAKRRFPGAKWFLVVDSDTLVFPERLLAHTRLPARNASVPVAFGATYRVKEKSLPKFTYLLGGAGIVISAGAMARMDLTKCITMQSKKLVWSEAPADWKLGLCLRSANVPLEKNHYMYQSNGQLVCGVRNTVIGNPFNFRDPQEIYL